MISGQRISLRAFQSCHLDASREWFNEPELARLLDRSHTITETEHRRWFDSLAEQSDTLYFAIETCNNGQSHVGNVWLSNIDQRHKKAELRIVIGDSNYHGRNVGSEAITLLCHHGFEQLGLHRIYAYVLAINPRARRAFEKAGFEVEGVLRQDRKTANGYTDVFLLGLLRPGHEGV